MTMCDCGSGLIATGVACRECALPRDTSRLDALECNDWNVFRDPLGWFVTDRKTGADVAGPCSCARIALDEAIQGVPMRSKKTCAHCGNAIPLRRAPDDYCSENCLAQSTPNDTVLTIEGRLRSGRLLIPTLRARIAELESALAARRRPGEVSE